jgi:hypothetical protein
MLKKLKKASPVFLGFLQASGVVLYVISIVTALNYFSDHNTFTSGQMYAPIVLLLAFIVSAVITGLMFLGRAGVLFWDKKYKEAFTLVGWTVGWSLVYLVILLVLIIK